MNVERTCRKEERVRGDRGIRKVEFMLIRMYAYISIEAERIYLRSGKVLMEGRKQASQSNGA